MNHKKKQKFGKENIPPKHEFVKNRKMREDLLQ